MSAHNEQKLAERNIPGMNRHAAIWGGTACFKCRWDVKADYYVFCT